MAVVYAGKLSWDTTDESLFEHFADFNPASAKVEYTTRLYSGKPRSKGWGLVEFKSEDDAEKAIDALNGSELEGRNILARLDRGPTAPSTSAPAPESKVSKETQVLFVRNLSWGTDDETLGKVFEEFGDVLSAEVTLNSSGKSRGYGIVEMGSVAEAKAAIDGMVDVEIDGRVVGVEFKRDMARGNKRAPRKTAPRRERGPIKESENVFFGNLPWNVDDARLEEFLTEYKVKACEVQYTKSERSKGFAVVTFDGLDEARDAIRDLNGTELDDGKGRKRKLTVRFDRTLE